MANRSVVLTVQRQVEAEDLAQALTDAGAEGLRIEMGMGDVDRTIKRFFNFLFSDPGAESPQRAAQGFVNYATEQFPDGWTHMRLGRDERGRHFILAVAEALGGEFFDEVSGEKLSFELPAGLAPR